MKIISTIRKQVKAFMTLANQSVGRTPAVPDEATVRFRARLITEETIEFLEATYGKIFEDVKFQLRDAITNKPLNVDIVEIIDATADLDYVVEGARLAYGVNGRPISLEVHRTNMAKFGPGSYKRPEDGKQMKPPGWKKPDILALLREQGYEG